MHFKMNGILREHRLQTHWTLKAKPANVQPQTPIKYLKSLQTFKFNFNFGVLQLFGGFISVSYDQLVWRAVDFGNISELLPVVQIKTHKHIVGIKLWPQTVSLWKY